MLPECDFARAKDTLADVFNQLKIAPLRVGPIKTISSSRPRSSATRCCRSPTAPV